MITIIHQILSVEHPLPDSNSRNTEVSICVDGTPGMGFLKATITGGMTAPAVGILCPYVKILKTINRHSS